MSRAIKVQECDEVKMVVQAMMIVMAVQYVLPGCTWEAEERHHQRWRPEPLHRTAPQTPQRAE